jgi:NitT/TauT family transport system ATP-binding protein
MGFIFQRPNLLPWLTVRQNIAFPQRILKLKGPKWDQVVEELLEIGRLTKYADAYPASLSGGMTQRVGVLRGMSFQPEVLLMDEPFGALDETLREQLDLETLGLWEKLGQTIVFITHNVREAVLMSHKVLCYGDPARPGGGGNCHRPAVPTFARCAGRPEVHRLRKADHLSNWRH